MSQMQVWENGTDLMVRADRQGLVGWGYVDHARMQMGRGGLWLEMSLMQLWENNTDLRVRADQQIGGRSVGVK